MCADVKENRAASKNNLSEIGISQRLDWARPSLSPHFLLEKPIVGLAPVLAYFSG